VKFLGLTFISLAGVVAGLEELPVLAGSVVVLLAGVVLVVLVMRFPGAEAAVRGSSVAPLVVTVGPVL